MFKAFDHQAEIWRKNPLWYLLGHGTGTGKSITALGLAEGKTLILVQKTQKLDQSFERNLALLGKKLDITVMSKEEFRKYYPDVPKADTLIVDESHNFVGVSASVKWRGGQEHPKTSQLFEKLSAYVKEVRPKRFYLLSATPAPKPMAVWAIASLLGRKWNYYDFRDLFYYRNSNLGRNVWLERKDKTTKGKLVKALQKLGDFKTLHDCYDVPAQTFKKEHIELTPAQKNELKEAKLLYPDPLVYRTKAYGIENGVHITFDIEQLSEKEYSMQKTTEFIDDNKIPRIQEITDEFPKVLVFAMFKAQVEKIAKKLKREGKTVFVMTGDTKDRKTVLEMAENASECVFIAQAGVSAGYELKSFRVVVWASRSNRWLDYEQGKGRVLRVDNLQKNLYIDLVTRGGVDEACYDTVKDGEDFQLKVTTK